MLVNGNFGIAHDDIFSRHSLNYAFLQLSCKGGDLSCKGGDLSCKGGDLAYRTFTSSRSGISNLHK